jgi:uncharacterized NAD(P)/FAD-binding protein YdhS
VERTVGGRERQSAHRAFARRQLVLAVIEVAVVGLGSWGLCAVERMVTGKRRERAHGPCLRIHVVEPSAPGAGVYGVTQPDYLLMNNPCSQLSMYPDPNERDDPRYGLGLYDWAVQLGYHWDGDACRIGDGRTITPHDFLPRRVMAEYLRWFYRTLVAEAPPTVEILHHSTAAIDVVPQPDVRECVVLANGDVICVHHVVLTSGHTPNLPRRGASGVEASTPYPVQRYVDSLPDDASVGVTGMGLVATDIVTALTVGRGGRFVDEGSRMRYLRNGREPVIHLASRSGLPYCAKAVSGVDQTGEYEPAIATASLFDHRRRLANGGSTLDLRADLLPPILAEMQLRYYEQSANLAGGRIRADTVRRCLTSAWTNNQFDSAIDAYARQYGRFDAAEHFFGEPPHAYVSSKDYEQHLYQMVESDLDACLMPGGSSPVKHAYEVLRILRDPMRSAIEFGGISLSSYVDFQTNIRNRVHRLVAGPPALRSQQLLALMDAGIVRTAFGPAPTYSSDTDGGARIGSTALARPYFERVDHLIQGYLDDPTVHRSASPLLARLYETGRIRQFHYGEVEVGSIDMTEDFHPIGAAGEVSERIWVFGVLTEGIRYFNHYIPSPKSRIRAFVDVQTCVDRIAC